MLYDGIVQFAHELVATKSEGDYVYLLTSEEQRYRLYSEQHMAADSEWLRAYENQQVRIEGALEDSDSLCVKTIQVIE